MPVQPIKPSEIAEAKTTIFPDEVIEAFNELIAENFTNGSAEVKQIHAVNRIQKKLECKRQEIFDRGWLNVEEMYRAVGWKVEYDKPGYNETYEPFFRFSK